MKTFTFRYDPGATLTNAMDKMIRAARSGVPDIQKNQMRSTSIGAILAVATENRLNLFRVIHDENPDSIYALAKLVDRDLSYVSKEVRVLEGLGLIRFEKTAAHGRERLKPIALYDRIVFDFAYAKDRVS